MGIIQIDIKTPKRCEECPCCCDIFPDENTPIAEWCNLLKREVDGDTKPNDCPLKEKKTKALPIMGTTICECNNCKHLLAEDMNYCPACGYKISEAPWKMDEM